MKKRILPAQYNRGMTLVELLVVLAIFAIVAGLTIFDYGTFRSTTSMQNLADDIALSVRKSQSYAIGAHISGTSFVNGYGVHFTSNQRPLNPLAGSNKAFVLFTDIASASLPPDKIYDYMQAQGEPCIGSPDQGDECSEILRIVSADQIAAIYLNEEHDPIPEQGFVDVTFLRPNPDAYFCYKASSDPILPCDRSTDISHITIVVADSRTITNPALAREIVIWNTGQISIQNYTNRNTVSGPGRDEGGILGPTQDEGGLQEPLSE